MLNSTTMLYSIGFCLAIAYSASTGGAGSLVGTTPNLLLKGYFDDHYEDGGLNFITYMAYRLLFIFGTMELNFFFIKFVFYRPEF